MGTAAQQREEGDMMKKQLVSILFALCMVLCLVPLAAFAEGETEKVQEVTDQTTLVAAMADGTVTTVKLAADINTGATLTVDREVTLDLNGFVLKYQNDSQRGSVIKVDINGNLTLKDSNTEKVHKFDKTNLLWTLAADDATGENIVDVPGGIITGGTGSEKPDTPKPEYIGGGVYVAADSSGSGTFTMTGGSIAGCTAHQGGGVYVAQWNENLKPSSVAAKFSMTGGKIVGCVADAAGGYWRNAYGGGICNYGSTELIGTAKIQFCNAINGDSTHGGGVYSTTYTLTINDNVEITGCTSPSNSSALCGFAICQISGGIFDGSVFLHANSDQSTVTGGIFYGNITSNITFSESAKVDVTFATDGGSAVGAQRVIRGQKAAPPTAPTKAGYTFDKWYNGTEVYDFDKPVTEPITLTAKWLTGEGTAASPILISNAEELKIFHDIVNGENNRQQNLAACATLTADIVLNDGTFDEDGNYTPGPSSAALTEWSPMGVNNSTVYAGTFDGAGHTIQGLYRSANKSLAGLFGLTNGATIKNVKVTGYLGSAKSAGGIAAHTEQTTITGCVNAATVNAYTGGQESIGGIVGTTELSSQIIDCINIGVIKCQAGDADPVFAGGIAGYLSSDSTISSCSNGGKVIGACNGNGSYCRSQIGGIVGIATLGTITDCYNAGSVTDITPEDPNSEPWVGGIVGSAPGHSSKYLSVTISNCYSTGSVTANNTTAKVGGITGNAENIAITNCYYLTGTAGQVCGKSDTASTVTNTTEKSAFDFANGGVLALLRANRPADAQPWDTTCKYLESAGMTLPVLARQNLTVHAHVWSAYTTDTAAKTHTHSCACGVAETEACTITPATCKDVSACAVCGQQYGGPDIGKHADLQHFPAVAATTDAEGNKEYWYCGGCGKYFADAAATREITRADTVTAKLPQPTTPPTTTPTAQPSTAPQAAEQPRRTAQPTVQPTAAPTVQPVSTIPATGDTSSPILWAALLLCGGAGLAVTAYKKNRHRS